MRGCGDPAPHRAAATSISQGRRACPRAGLRPDQGAELLARIRPLVDARPSYGYRRVAALLNRQAEVEELARPITSGSTE